METAIPVVRDGDVAPFVIEDALSSAAEEIAALNWDVEAVPFAVVVSAHWNGPPVPSYGR